METFDKILPGVEHRFCVRHLYANFKLRFKDKALRDVLWAAARAYRPDHWQSKMRELQIMNCEAYQWLSSIPSELWARSLFNPRSKCDLLSNNISECFNQFISSAREEPILTMFETIRRMVMCRFQEKRDWIAKVRGNICPRIHDKLEFIKSKSFDFEPIQASPHIWEVVDLNKQYVVNISRRTCTCMEWDLTGIPCVHARASIMDNGAQPDDFVHSYYSVENYKKAYRYVIMPIPDQSQWVVSNGDPTDPPIIRRRPGRPKKVRKKSAGEERSSNPSKVTRKGTKHYCSNCGEYSHNKRRCPNPLKSINKKNSADGQVSKCLSY